MTEFKVGLSTGVSYSAYDQIDALRSTVLKDMRRSPAHCRYNIDHPKEATDAMVVGDATHAAILEPERFEKQYASRPYHNPEFEWSMKHKNSNAYKEGREIWEAEHHDSVVLDDPEYNMACALRDSCWKHPLVKRLLTGEGKNEVVGCWIDPATDTPCKCRIDRLVTYEGHTIILDFKSTKDASPWAIGRDSAKFGYNLQGAWYRRGLNILQPRPRQVWLVAPEKEAPFCIGIYKIPNDALDAAESNAQTLMYRYTECQKSHNWPGYSPNVELLSLPKYAYYDEGADDE